MSLADVVCPTCRRFWHGPAGQLPFPSPQGRYCENEGHALGRRPDRVQVVRRDGSVEVDWLTLDDEREAHEHARAVCEYAKRAGLNHSRGEFDSFEAEVENRRRAFLAEKAVAVFAGEPWNKVVGVRRDVPDVGADIEVKWRSRPNGELIIRPEDNESWRFVLARGWPTLTLAGWIYGVEASDLRVSVAWARNSRDHWIPADRLRPIGSLQSGRGTE